jgi:hypothetical protein
MVLLDCCQGLTFSEIHWFYSLELTGCVRVLLA